MKFVSGNELSGFSKLMSLDIDARYYASEWEHCDQLSNFFGNSLSFGQSDSFRYGNLLSTFANEILECLFWQNAKTDSISLSIIEKDNYLGFHLLVPKNDQVTSFFDGFVEEVKTVDIQKKYQDVLGREDSLPGMQGLYELVANYDVEVAYSRDSDRPNSLHFAVIVDIETAIN